MEIARELRNYDYDIDTDNIERNTGSAGDPWKDWYR